MVKLAALVAALPPLEIQTYNGFPNMEASSPDIRDRRSTEGSLSMENHKLDLTGRSHDLSGGAPPADYASFLISAGPADRKTVLDWCKPKEISDKKWLGLLLVGSSAFTATSSCLAFHVLFGDGAFRPSLVVAGVFVGGLVGVSDRVNFYLGTLHSKGMAELANAGLKLPEIVPNKRTRLLVRGLRIAQAATFGALSGVFFLLAANGSDIEAYLANQFLVENRPVATEMAKIVDGNIALKRAALELATGEVKSITQDIRALQNSDVRRQIAAGRKAGSHSVTGSPQVAVLERKLADKEAKRNAFNDEVVKLTEGRNEEIEKGVGNAATHVPRKTGLPAKLHALGTLIYNDPKMLLVAAALEFVALMLELGPMLASANYIPSAYAARVALDHFVEVTELVKSGARRLGAKIPAEDANAALEAAVAREPAAPDTVEGDGLPSQQPPAAPDSQAYVADGFTRTASNEAPSVARRPRGRPRRNGVAPSLNGGVPAIDGGQHV